MSNSFLLGMWHVDVEDDGIGLLGDSFGGQVDFGGFGRALSGEFGEGGGGGFGGDDDEGFGGGAGVDLHALTVGELDGGVGLGCGAGSGEESDGIGGAAVEDVEVVDLRSEIEVEEIAGFEGNAFAAVVDRIAIFADKEFVGIVFRGFRHECAGEEAIGLFAEILIDADAADEPFGGVDNTEFLDDHAEGEGSAGAKEHGGAEGDGGEEAIVAAGDGFEFAGALRTDGQALILHLVLQGATSEIALFGDEFGKHGAVLRVGGDQSVLVDGQGAADFGFDGGDLGGVEIVRCLEIDEFGDGGFVEIAIAEIEEIAEHIAVPVCRRRSSGGEAEGGEGSLQLRLGVGDGDTEFEAFGFDLLEEFFAGIAFDLIYGDADVACEAIEVRGGGWGGRGRRRRCHRGRSGLGHDGRDGGGDGRFAIAEQLEALDDPEADVVIVLVARIILAVRVFGANGVEDAVESGGEFGSLTCGDEFLEVAKMFFFSFNHIFC